MPIDPAILRTKPGDDRADLGKADPQSLLSFDLNTPDTAPDEWKRAAARRASGALGVPDPDGRVWRADKQPFKTGEEYLGFMRGMIKSGDIWERAATDELKAFEAADDAGRLAIARAALTLPEKAGGALGRLAEGYGLPDEAFKAAPEEVRAANARLRADDEERRRYNLGQTAASGPFAPARDAGAAEADRAAVKAWRSRRDDAEAVEAHREKLLKDNLWNVWLAVSPALSDRGREIAAAALKDRRLAGADIADFRRLPEKEQAVVAKLARLSRAPAAGGFWNTLGDAGVGFVNTLVRTPANAARQIGTLTDSVDQAVFGPDAGLVDRDALNRRAREEQRLYEALGDWPGLDPSGAGHGYFARSLIGAAATLPYMAYASVPYAGTSAVALDFMQRLDDRLAEDGGDVYADDPAWIARKAVWGALYAGVEKLSALPVFKDAGDVALKTMFLKLATRHGAAAAERLALHVGKETFKESLEEAAQRVIEEHAASVGLGRGAGWREAARGGVEEFAESLGTMGFVALTGSARQGLRARAPKGREALAEFTAGTLRRESFALDDNLRLQRDVNAQMEVYRAEWESGGRAALEKRADLSPEQAGLLSAVFEGEADGSEVARHIAGRDIWAGTHPDAGAPARLTEGDARRIAAGPDGAKGLEAAGYTQAGAARLRDFFEAERKAYESLEAALRASGGAAVPESEAADAVARLEELRPLRDLYQRAGTPDGAAKAFREIGFTEAQAGRMAEAFHMEHRLATSPQAAAAFRAFYVETSSELPAAERLRRMTGLESAPAPEHGDGAARLTLRDGDGTARGSVLYLPGQAPDFDPESPHAGEAVEQATGGAVTAAEWSALSAEGRRDAARTMGIRANGGFEITDESDPAVRADGRQADILTGRLTLAADAPSATLYHEAAHAWLAVMRRAGKITDADVKKLRDRYGAAPGDAGWFNEEALADDIREIGAEADFAPDRPLASRFVAAVRRLAGAARQAEARRKAASGARQALYESIVYGRAFGGVGDFGPAPAAGKGAASAGPIAGASTAAPESPQPAAGDAQPEPSNPKSEPRNRDKTETKSRKPDGGRWSAATPQGNMRVAGTWIIAPRDRFISDTDPRYDFSLQGRTRDATVSSSAQVAGIAAQGTFDPLRLLDSPDTANGAPVVFPVTLKDADGKDETFYMVLSGNGRFRALDAVDADNRGDEYRGPVKAFADERGIPYAPADMTASARPRLARVIGSKPADATLQRLASLSNQNAVLQMTDAEQAAADAELIERDGTAGLFSANKDGLPSKTGSDEFFAWLVRATGDASLADSKGNPTDAARTRARRAMLALAVGKGPRGKATVAAFTESAEALGLERQRDALLMSAGTLSALEDAKPEYGLSGELSRAAADLLRIAADRKAGKTAGAESAIAQGDMLDAMPPAAAETLRLLDSARPSEGIAEAFRRYAELAARIDTATPDMFGEPPAAKEDLLKKAAADTEIPAAPGARYSLEETRLTDAELLRRNGIRLKKRQYEERRGEQGVFHEVWDVLDEETGVKLSGLLYSSEFSATAAARRIIADRRDRTRYSLALAARRYALATGMPAEGERLVAAQLEFLFARQYDPERQRKLAEAARKRRETIAGKERAKLEGVRDASARAFENPDDPEAWRAAFDAAGDTVSRVIHRFFTQDGPQRFARSHNGKPLYGLKIETPEDFAALLMPLRNPYQESMKAVFLDEDDRVIAAEVCTVGLLDSAPVHPREIFKRGAALGAAKVLLAHNHPSGDPRPSKEDADITDRLAAAGRIIGIEYVDHVITDGTSYYSMTHGLREFAGGKADWEAAAAGTARAIRSPEDLAPIIKALRQGGGGHAHAVLLDTKNRITAVRRIPLRGEGAPDAAALDLDVIRAAARAAVSNPTRAVLIDLTAAALTAGQAADAHRRMGESLKILGIELTDTIWNDGGMARSIRAGGQAPALMPLTPDAASGSAAESPGPRYSLSAADPLAWMREYYDESYGEEQAGEARDARGRLSADLADVIAAHTHPNGKRKESWLRAPNGKPTNLEERQWALVRTPAFKAWFGDWEGDPAAASKAVDENGEPMVVWHGSPRAGFSEFRMPTDPRTGSRLGHYFSKSRMTAATYSGMLKTVDRPGEPEFDRHGNPHDRYEAVYPVFLNMRAPRAFDFGGRKWNRHPEGDSFTVGQRVGKQVLAYYKNDGSPAVFDNEADAERFLQWANRGRDEKPFFIARSEATTRTLAQKVITEADLGAKTDGIIFRNVIDTGGFDVFSENLIADESEIGPDDVFVVLENNQIKSANANTGAYSAETDDIRYSVQTRRLEPYNLPDALAEVSAGTSVAALSQTALKEERARHKALRDAEDWAAAEDYAGELSAAEKTRALGQYLLAKYHGDAAAAKAVVERWAKPEEALRIKAKIGETGLLRPVVAAPCPQAEGNRFNALPHVYAAWLAARLNGVVSRGFRKADGSGAANTGAAMADRLARDYAFEGGEDIDSASPVILVDDVWTSGQTLWTVYEHLKAVNPDARVAAFAAIASGRYGKNVRPAQKQLTAFWEKSNLSTVSFRERVGNDIEKLTGSEIQAYLLTGGRGPDASAAFFGGGPRPDRGADAAGGRDVRRAGGPSPALRYAIDVSGAAYGENRRALLTGFMAHAALTGAAFPSPRTISRLADRIGVASFDYDALASAARRLAAETEDAAIRKAASSADPAMTAYAVGELARAAARAYVRAGAGEGERLARSADRIRALSEDGARRAVAAVTGADYADIETDTDVDVAASILAADPKRFQPEEEPARAGPSAAAAAPDGDAADPEPQGTPGTDEEDPELTDRQRAEAARKRKEREARIQGYLDAARERGAKSRFRDEERRRRKAANDKADAEERAGSGAADAGGAAGSGKTPPAAAEDDGPAVPVDFSDRWEAAAFLRVWAFDRFRRDNPNRSGGADLSRDPVAVEFYRKTAVRELRELARKLLTPGYPRETVTAYIGDIAPGLRANSIEAKTAHILGMINRHAVREERRSLVKKFRAELKRQFVKGAAFEELGVDLGRALTGAVEEDARYVMRVCELSDAALDGELSALQAERARLNAVIAERETMTAEDGTPLPAGDDDMQTRKALRQLALLDRFGGMADMMPGEILDLTGEALATLGREAEALRERWQAYDELVKSIRVPLAAAIARGPDDPQSEETAAGAVADSLTGMLRLRLDFLTRHADPAKREAARAAIADLMDLLARGNTDLAVALQEDEAALNRALGEIFARPDGRPDRKRVRAFLRRMDEKIPAELAARLTRQGRQETMTHGQMLQLLASLDQWASYRDNIIRHERQGQAALIRSYVFEDPRTGETRRALTNDDVMVLEWLRRRFYSDKRAAITDVTERIAGRSVDSPDPLYHPVRMRQDKRAALHVGQGAWQPLAGVFSRRVKNRLDFDESASILDVFRERSRETALLTAFSERGLAVREILTSQQFQDAVRRFHGPAALTRILKQAEQTLNGGRPRGQDDAHAAAASLAMRVTTYAGLGWNLASAAKQAVSLPVFANAVGFRRLWQILASPPDMTAVRRLKESDEYRARYGTGPGSGMDIATRAAYDSPQDSAFKRFFADWGLYANRKTDWIISAWVGQGIYRDLKAKYIDQGMAEADADRRAVSETFTAIEETQQSGRAENALALTREYGVLGKVLTQFATSPLQQMQYEIVSFREWRDLAANGGAEAGIREARDRFMRALVINHIIVPGLMAAVTGLYKAATGDEPEWKKEGFWWTLLIAAIMGQFSRVLFAGALAEQTLGVLFLRKPPRMGQLVPAEGVIRFTGNLAYPVRDIVTWDTEHFRADLIRALKSTAFTRLPVTVYENLTEE